MTQFPTSCTLAGRHVGLQTGKYLTRGWHIGRQVGRFLLESQAGWKVSRKAGLRAVGWKVGRQICRLVSRF